MLLPVDPDVFNVYALNTAIRLVRRLFAFSIHNISINGAMLIDKKVDKKKCGNKPNPLILSRRNIKSPMDEINLHNHLRFPYF